MFHEESDYLDNQTSITGLLRIFFSQAGQQRIFSQSILISQFIFHDHAKIARTVVSGIYLTNNSSVDYLFISSLGIF